MYPMRIRSDFKFTISMLREKNEFEDVHEFNVSAVFIDVSTNHNWDFLFYMLNSITILLIKTNTHIMELGMYLHDHAIFSNLESILMKWW